MKPAEFIEGVREAIGLWTDGGPKGEALGIIADLLDQLPPPKTCAHCNEALGDKYAQGIPNVGDLCPDCHKPWLAEKEAEKKAKRDKHGHLKACYSVGCNAAKCGTSTPPPLRSPFDEGPR